MQLANITVAIAGDNGNTVKKYQVTPSEVAVLRVIHSEDSVTEIEVTGEDKRTTRAEKERLSNIYGLTKDANNNSVLATLFPGVAARLFEKFDELELPEEFFKATARSTATAPVVTEDPVDDTIFTAPPKETKLDTPAKSLTKKQQKAADAAAKQKAIDDAVEDDGIEEMPGTKTDVLG